jgi:hypothetical protein
MSAGALCGTRRWLAMTPEQRQRAQERYSRWKDLTPEQQELERVYLAQRTVEGLPSTAPYRPLPSAPAVQAGWLYEHAGRLKCTPEGWLRLDSIVNDYDRAAH